MISETILVPFVLWCAYMPPEPSDYQERPQICGRIYNTKEKCIEQQAHVDEMFLPKCAPLKTNSTQTSASRTGSRLHHPVVAAGHSGSIDDVTLSTGAYFLWCSSHDLNQCNRIYANRDRCIEEFMTAPTEDARCLPLKFDAPPAAFQPKSQDRHPDSIDAQQQAAPPPVEYVLVYMLTCWTPQMRIRPVCGRWYATPGICSKAAGHAKGKTRCVPRKVLATYIHPAASQKGEHHRLPDSIFWQAPLDESQSAPSP
jgi:hypothetical protein